jgi:hypothetical protein
MTTLSVCRHLLAPVLPVFLIGAFTVPPTRAADSDASIADPSVVSAIASQWLANWNARNWEACWNAFSPDVRLNIKLYKWDIREGYYEDHLGKLISRKFLKVERTLIRGDVVIVEFESTYEHVGLRNEGIYLEMAGSTALGIYAMVNKPTSVEWPWLFGGDAAGSRPLEIAQRSVPVDATDDSSPVRHAVPFGDTQLPNGRDLFSTEVIPHDVHLIRAQLTTD